MQQLHQYLQHSTIVNRTTGKQNHRCSVLIGAVRIRVSGDFETIMDWVWLALAERQGAVR